MYTDIIATLSESSSNRIQDTPKGWTASAMNNRKETETRGLSQVKIPPSCAFFISYTHI